LLYERLCDFSAAAPPLTTDGLAHAAITK